MMLGIARFDDTIFIEEGFRKEQVDKAITFYEIDKEQEEQERRGDFFGADERRRLGEFAGLSSKPTAEGGAVRAPQSQEEEEEIEAEEKKAPMMRKSG